MALFQSVDALRERDSNSPRTRIFYGDGTSFIRIPNHLKLNKVDQIFIDGMPVPEFRQEEHPSDPQFTRFFTCNMPLWMIEETDLGQVIVRSELSNHGTWQPKSEIRIVGDWEEVGEAPEPETERETEEPKSRRGPGRPLTINSTPVEVVKTAHVSKGKG